VTSPAVPISPRPLISCQAPPACLGANQAIGSTLSEDCLVNVFTPSNATSNSKLPVWFYIQGGGFAQNGLPNVNGTDVLLKSELSIVSVQINYCVGLCGLLSSEEIREDGNLHAGLLDQRKALRWAQNNMDHVCSIILYLPNTRSWLKYSVWGRSQPHRYPW
jgi:carboxylesterase type B